MCDPSSFLDYTWSTYDDVCGSDHYPIIIKNDIITHDHTQIKQTGQNFINSAQYNSKEKIQTIEKFTETLITIARECIPQNSIPNKKSKPWFNAECKKAIQQKKAALKRFKTEPATKNCVKYKQKRAKACKIIKETKKKCWQEYISKISISAKPKTKWKMVRKIPGKHNPPRIINTLS